MTATTPAFALDDLHRINDALDRVAALELGDRITVQISGAADTEPCVEDCGADGDLLVHWGYAQACYRDWLCTGCLRRFLTIHVRHDKARPVVDIPAVLGDAAVSYPVTGPYSGIPT